MADEAIQEMLKMFDERELIVALERRQLVKRFSLMRRITDYDLHSMPPVQQEEYRNFVRGELSQELGYELLKQECFVDFISSRNAARMCYDTELRLTLLAKPSIYA
jgi:hypothetical protein